MRMSRSTASPSAAVSRYRTSAFCSSSRSSRMSCSYRLAASARVSRQRLWARAGSGSAKHSSRNGTRNSAASSAQRQSSCAPAIEIAAGHPGRCSSAEGASSPDISRPSPRCLPGAATGPRRPRSAGRSDRRERWYRLRTPSPPDLGRRAALTQATESYIESEPDVATDLLPFTQPTHWCILAA